MSGEPIYFFVHIPKTGGQSVRTHIRKHFRFRDRMLAVNAKSGDARSLFESLSSEDRDNCKLIVGHRVNYSLAAYFQNREPRFFAVLRHPVSHVISSYNWEAHRFFQMHGCEPMSFDHWFKKRKKQNLMSRWLLTHFYGRSSTCCDDYTQDQLLREASEVLAKFWLVANLEDLEHTIAPAFHALGLPREIKERRNVADRDYPKRVHPTSEIEARVHQAAAADMRLYERFCGSSGA